MSKGYTINYFINTFKNVTKRKLFVGDVYDIVSPRGGYWSVKAEALDRWLEYFTSDIVNGHGAYSKYGKTPRARLLTALKNRKKNGHI